MSTQQTCLDPALARHLYRDGLGWGHDLDCGCFHAPYPKAPGLIRRIAAFLGGRTQR